ncbi:MAG: ABC transporter permease [Actinobacteria bacterium]|uniref:Thiamine pyrimidine synthase n=1 Tax=freshwater metagenome TaxID=449393 RepID=A0A6J7J505_9ZZZZ|nr:ABC transporter permease [Actinomycetota bacterium]
MVSRSFRLLLLTIASAIALASCSSAPAPAPTTSGSSSPSAAATTPAELTPVSLALSWTPNTDYTGVYVAQQKGYYAAQGIQLTILPYASTAPETLVASGAADFGFSYQAGVTYARAAGQDVVSVFAPNQKGTYAIGVAATRADITRPRDLDGKIYAGFGTPDELPLLRTIIRNDGGKGEFTNVTLDTTAYEAVSNGTADFTIPVATWDAVQAKAAGKPMKLFALTDYGFPDQYSVLIVTSGAYLTGNADVARRFVAATQQGYAFAVADPAAGAQAMVDADPNSFPNPELVAASERMLVDGGYRTDANGIVGTQQLERWTKYGEFLYRNKLLADSTGAPLTTEPDWATYFTNELMP